MFVLNNDKKLFITLIVILNINVNLYSECCTACSSGKNKKNQYVDNNKKNISNIPKYVKIDELSNLEKIQLSDTKNQLQKDVIILKQRCEDLLK